MIISNNSHLLFNKPKPKARKVKRQMNTSTLSRQKKDKLGYMNSSWRGSARERRAR